MEGAQAAFMGTPRGRHPVRPATISLSVGRGAGGQPSVFSWLWLASAIKTEQTGLLQQQVGR